MKGDWWSWIALIAFLVFCCLPMLFMGRRGRLSHEAAKKDADGPTGDKGESK